MNILNANLKPTVAKHFLKKPVIFQNDNTPAHSSKFTRNRKIKKEIPGVIWSAQSLDVNKVKIYGTQSSRRYRMGLSWSERKQCWRTHFAKIWRSLPIVYILSVSGMDTGHGSGWLVGRVRSKHLKCIIFSLSVELSKCSYCSQHWVL